MSVHKNRDIRIPIDKDNPSIIRIEELCNDCGHCRLACENASAVGRMYDLESADDVPVCMNCGQCSSICPTNAIRERYEYQAVRKAIKDPDKIVILHTAPSIRAGLGEEFGNEPGTFVEGKMVAAIRALNVDYVLDTNFSADLTIMEEGSELVDRIVNQSAPLPQFTSCCPAWVKFVETFYPEFIPNISTAKSPTGMQGATIKTYFAKHKDIDPAKIVSVAVMPCTAKKFEIRREEMCHTGDEPNSPELRDNDYVLTTRELAKWLKEEGVDFNALEDSKFDEMMSEAAGAGVIFGNTGGVMEAAARSAYFLVTGKQPPDALLSYEPIRGLEGIKTATADLDGTKVKLAVIHGLDNAKRFMDELRKGIHKDVHFAEVMCCHGGCISGGGQPKTEIPTTREIRKARIKALYDRDATIELRCSHNNAEIATLYKDFYEKPLSEKSHHLLHTTYQDRSDDLGARGAVDLVPKRRSSLVICDILMFICLLILIWPPAALANMFSGDRMVFHNFHVFMGFALTFFLLVHIIINFREIVSIGNISNYPTPVILRYVVMYAVLITMATSIITGIMWFTNFAPRPVFVGDLHAYSSWAAFLLTGVHVILHLSKFVSLRRA